MKTARPKVAALCVALAALIGASAESCTPGSAAIPGCQITTTPPPWAAKKFTTDGTGLVVVKVNAMNRIVQGTVWARCPIPPQSHVLDMEIWARPQNSVGDLFKFKSAAFKDMPGKDWTPYTLSAPFITGDYEIRYTVFVTNQDGPQPPESGKGYRATFTVNDW